MTDDLATALRTLADSEPPPPMDVERVLREGRRSLVRRRKAALGGGTAVLAVTGLAVAALAPPGSLGHRHTAPAAMRTLAPAVNPHDPIITRFQFGYLPEGMHADGGTDTPAIRNQYSWSTHADSASSAWQLMLSQVPPDFATLVQPTGQQIGGIPVPAVVPGATQAFWMVSEGEDIVRTSPDGDQASLMWHLPSGEWLELRALNLQVQSDWKAETLKAAANVIRQDRTVPMPIKISGKLPSKFDISTVYVGRVSGKTISHIELDAPGLAPVDIVAYDPDAADLAARMEFGTNKICKDAKGLTVCVTTTLIPPDILTTIGGPQGLLDRITSLGGDPANWTQDVLQ